MTGRQELVRSLGAVTSRGTFWTSLCRRGRRAHLSAIRDLARREGEGVSSDTIFAAALCFVRVFPS